VTTYEYDTRSRLRAVSRGLSATDLRERMEYTYDPNTSKRNGTKYFARENNAWVEKRSEASTLDT
jgi:hypothetical protein